MQKLIFVVVHPNSTTRFQSQKDRRLEICKIRNKDKGGTLEMKNKGGNYVLFMNKSTYMEGERERESNVMFTMFNSYPSRKIIKTYKFTIC